MKCDFPKRVAKILAILFVFARRFYRIFLRL